ncbi:MAG: enoyl-CoA hydratase/isomerase family protein [Actinobacteria bacterium]|nr:enoyl-CoA hydratase/isomerase family protein [Actinomycetota bacterium]
MTAYEYLLVDDEPGGVRLITLNRPDKLNSWNDAMRAEMAHAIEQVARSSEIKAVIIAGKGRAFSAGEDVSEMESLGASGTRPFRSVLRHLHHVFDTIEELEVPVIAAIDGVAAGGGVELALSCDFRVMGAGSRFVMPEVRVGLIPGSGGCSRLVKHVGLGRAKELVMLGAAIDAKEAREIGLATRIVPQGSALAGARELAGELAKLAPLAIGMAKMVLNTCADIDAHTGRRLERLGQSVLKTTEDHIEGARAFATKRLPEWKAR